MLRQPKTISHILNILNEFKKKSQPTTLKPNVKLLNYFNILVGQKQSKFNKKGSILDDILLEKKKFKKLQTIMKTTYKSDSFMTSKKKL
jgi:hypothetical protein